MAISSNSAKFVKKGDTLDYTIAAAGTAVNCGDFVKAGGCVCLAIWDIAAGTSGTLKILHKGEVITVTADDAIGATDAGVAIYLDASLLITKNATSGSGEATVNNTLLGYTAKSVGATDKTFDVICA